MDRPCPFRAAGTCGLPRAKSPARQRTRPEKIHPRGVCAGWSTEQHRSGLSRTICSGTTFAGNDLSLVWDLHLGPDRWNCRNRDEIRPSACRFRNDDEHRRDRNCLLAILDYVYLTYRSLSIKAQRTNVSGSPILPVDFPRSVVVSYKMNVWIFLDLSHVK